MSRARIRGLCCDPGSGGPPFPPSLQGWGASKISPGTRGERGASRSPLGTRSPHGSALSGERTRSRQIRAPNSCEFEAPRGAGCLCGLARPLGAETDVDCGGTACLPCADGSACADDIDCASDHCSVDKCGYITSCLEIKQDEPKSESGVYFIDPDGPGEGAAIPVYCDQETDDGGWTLVYKLSSAVGGDPYSLWSGGPVNEADTGLLGPLKSDKHYVSSFVGKFWNANGVTLDQARVHIYRDGSLERFWTFGAGGSTKTSWFESPRLLASSYVDLQKGPFNVFSIAGDNWKGTGRRWFINKNYEGCGSDNGWLVVDTDWNYCSWETNKGSPAIRILYSAGPSYINWSTATNTGTIGSGDVFAVFVR